MPRIAATLASLVLAASAIGVNVAQYPIVWQMVNGPDRPNSQAVAAKSAPAAATLPAAPLQPAAPNAVERPKDAAQKTASTESAPPHKPPPAAEKASAGTGSQGAEKPAAAAEAQGAIKPAVAAGHDEPVTHIVGTRPLVPVVMAGLSSQSQAPPGADYQVRRLPPADPAAFAAQPAPSAAMADAPPAYPCTRTP